MELSDSSVYNRSESGFSAFFLPALGFFFIWVEPFFFLIYFFFRPCLMERLVFLISFSFLSLFSLLPWTVSPSHSLKHVLEVSQLSYNTRSIASCIYLMISFDSRSTRCSVLIIQLSRQQKARFKPFFKRTLAITTAFPPQPASSQHLLVFLLMSNMYI